jgi:hypothetical protein
MAACGSPLAWRQVIDDLLDVQGDGEKPKTDWRRPKDGNPSPARFGDCT